MEFSIIDRDENEQIFNPDAITKRVKQIISGKFDNFNLEDLQLPYGNILKKTISQLDNGIHTSDIDIMMANIAYSSCIYNRGYLKLSSRLLISNHLKNINHFNKLFKYDASNIVKCYSMTYASHKTPLLSSVFMGFLVACGHLFDSTLDGTSNFNVGYNGYKLLAKNYLLKMNKNNFNNEEFINRMHVLFGVEIDILNVNKINKIIQERNMILETPEYMLFRVCVALCLPTTEKIKSEFKTDEIFENDLQYYIRYFERCSEIDEIVNCVINKFNVMKCDYYTHATPTLFNSGTINQQFASCFLIGVDDNIDSIGEYYKNCMKISKNAGGIGSHATSIRCENSYIHGTGGTSNGIAPMLRVSNEISLYIDQGGNKRAGSNAIYLEPWHGDIEKFLNLKSINQVGAKAPDLFYALWINDEFNRVLAKEYELKNQGKPYKLWYLMDPAECPMLLRCFDETLNTGWVENPQLGKYSFTYYYRKYVEENKYTKIISALDLWQLVCKITSETGTPYKCFKDAANRKTNQSNLGIIRSSNLCTEIYEYSDAEEIAVCNLASLCLPKFITSIKPHEANKYPFSEGFKQRCSGKVLYFDFEKLVEITKIITENLNNTIDKSVYPLRGAKNSNMKNRPIGIGVQGLADIFSKLWLPWGSMDALKLDFHIFEYIYYAGLLKSNELAVSYGVYKSYEGSPASKGLLQMDLWKLEYQDREDNLDWNPVKFSYSCDWDKLRNLIKKDGLYNSLIVAPMPTASTSTIKGNSPCIEPFNALIYKRSNKYGETILYNENLIESLSDMNLWSIDLVNKILESRTGGIQDTDLPNVVKQNYKTAFEISPRIVIDHALVRSVFVDQGISLNLFIPDPTNEILTKVYMYAWKRGIKTGTYYTRRLAPVDAKKIKIEEQTVVEEKNIICEDEVCIMCQG